MEKQAGLSVTKRHKPECSNIHKHIYGGSLNIKLNKVINNEHKLITLLRYLFKVVMET